MQRRQLGLGADTADLAAFISIAPMGEQFARELYTYKNPAVGADDRPRKTIGLGAVLWKWLGIHESCVARQVGVGQFDLITTVSSTSGRAMHPLPALPPGSGQLLTVSHETCSA